MLNTRHYILTMKNMIKINSNIKQINFILKFNFIKMKDIQRITSENKQAGYIRTLKCLTGHMLSTIWKDFKLDLNVFMQLRKMPVQQLSIEQKYLLRRIRSDLIKFGPAFGVFNVPFGFPLFYLYLRLFPRLIPTWMLVDTFHDKIEMQKISKAEEAWKYFKQKYGQTVGKNLLLQIVDRNNQSLQDLRRISSICYGHYIDGTSYLSDKLNITLNGLISPTISKMILKLNLMRQLKLDYSLEDKLRKAETFEEKLKIKLQSIL